MWSIILNCILSITFIFIANHIWDYCKNNYTSQKTKDLVEIHASKYKQIAEDMERKIVVPTKREDDAPPIALSDETSYALPSGSLRNCPKNQFLQKEEKEWMNRELAEFIETL